MGQAPPLVIATVTGTERLLTVEGDPPTVAFSGNSDTLHPHARASARSRPLRDRRHARRNARGGGHGSVGATRLVRPRGDPARERRSAGRDRLPAERVPHPARTTDAIGDDGRRRLLGRYRQRRLARSLRGQLVLRSRLRLLGSSTAGRRGARSSGTGTGRSPTSAGRRGPGSRSAATAASPATSTATGSATST